MIIIDYGVGNIGSIINMFKKIGVSARISADANEIRQAQQIILPGVGSFDYGMNCLNRSGLRDILEHKALHDKVPILGICLGMQLLTKRSEEGKESGLGWIPAECVKFDNKKFTGERAESMRIPHMGWNLVEPHNNCRLFASMDAQARFYFVHSYHAVCENKDNVGGITNYGYEFASVIQQDNIFGAQFHPEKSHVFGMEILKNFVQQAIND